MNHAVKFVDVENMARWIQREGGENIITGMVDYLEADYREWERFDKIPRVASHTPFGVIELMPTSNGKEYSFKYVNGHPSNPARGFQTVTAFGVLAHVDNGYPILLSEMTLLTALRTAATSASTSSRPGSSTSTPVSTASPAARANSMFGAAPTATRTASAPAASAARMMVPAFPGSWAWVSAD